MTSTRMFKRNIEIFVEGWETKSDLIVSIWFATIYFYIGDIIPRPSTSTSYLKWILIWLKCITRCYYGPSIPKNVANFHEIQIDLKSILLTGMI